MKQEYVTELKSETEALYSTENVPSEIKGAYQIAVTSETPFIVIINGRTKRTIKSLKATHPTPLTIENIRGMRKVGYLAPRDSVSPSSMATQILLEPRVGDFDISGYEIIPDLSRLNKKVDAGKGEAKYRDPRFVQLDGETHINLDSVYIRGLRRGKVEITK